MKTWVWHQLPDGVELGKLHRPGAPPEERTGKPRPMTKTPGKDRNKLEMT